MWGWPTSHSLPFKAKTQVLGAKTIHEAVESGGPEARRAAETSGNSRRTQTWIITECSNGGVQVLRTVKNGVSTPVHSFHIVSCNLTPRPSCIEMRDWWHEDRGLYSLKSSHAYICENTLPCPFVALCCSKSEISSLLELCTIPTTIANRGKPGHRNGFPRKAT